MKKYVKPELFFESFELSQQIAACVYDVITDATDTRSSNNVAVCGFIEINEFTGEENVVFLDSTAACSNKVESYCQHVSAAEYNIFNS